MDTDKTQMGPPLRHDVELTDGSAMFLPHSCQVIFYDKLGQNLWGWDWRKQYGWVVTGCAVPIKEMMDRMLTEFLAAQKITK